MRQSCTPKRQINETLDRIEGEHIILDGNGSFPKEITIVENENQRSYRLRKTKKGNYLFN